MIELRNVNFSRSTSLGVQLYLDGTMQMWVDAQETLCMPYFPTISILPLYSCLIMSAISAGLSLHPFFNHIFIILVMAALKNSQ